MSRGYHAYSGKFHPGRNNYCLRKECRYIFLLILIFFYPVVTHAQFSWKINGEAGYFNSSASGIADDQDILSRLDAQLKYQYSSEDRQALINFRIRPELYGFDNKLGTLKFKLSGNYLQDEENFSWGFNLSTQRQEFRDAAFSSGSESFLIEGIINLWSGSLPVSLMPGYAYQLMKSDPFQDQDMDIIFLDANINQYVNNYLEINYGLYSEYFSINDNTNIFPMQPANESTGGWRAGPQAGFRYIKDFIIDGSYRFLVHHSKETEFPSFEHQVKLMAGKILLPGFSAFVLVNYYYRDLKTKTNSQNNNTFLYTPINSENNVYLKLGYEISDNIESYVKYGYANENLFYKEYSLKGWSLLLGIELNGL